MKKRPWLKKKKRNDLSRDSQRHARCASKDNVFGVELCLCGLSFARRTPQIAVIGPPRHRRETRCAGIFKGVRYKADRKHLLESCAAVACVTHVAPVFPRVQCVYQHVFASLCLSSLLFFFTALDKQILLLLYFLVTLFSFLIHLYLAWIYVLPDVNKRL